MRVLDCSGSGSESDVIAALDELDDDANHIRDMRSINCLSFPALAEKAAGIESASARSTKAPNCRQFVRYAEDEDLGNSFRMGKDIR